MFKDWDPDRNVLVVLLVAASIALAVTYRQAVAETADRIVKTVKSQMGRFTPKSPKVSQTPSHLLAAQRRLALTAC